MPRNSLSLATTSAPILTTKTASAAAVRLVTRRVELAVQIADLQARAKKVDAKLLDRLKVEGEVGDDGIARITVPGVGKVVHVKSKGQRRLSKKRLLALHVKPTVIEAAYEPGKPSEYPRTFPEGSPERE